MKQARSDSMGPMGASKVRLASVADLDALVPLFEAYRAFYGAPANETGARQFLLERLRFNQSTIFLVQDSLNAAVGFAQLYPFFTSVGLAQVFVLNDLFVVESHRGTGAVTQLLESIRAHAKSCGVAKLRLSTAVTNQRAQRVYERAGWQRNDEFHTYELALADKKN